ncbi:MAG: hypothetical protein ACXVRW_11470 [Solirubrobacteraceae bacterium]
MRRRGAIVLAGALACFAPAPASAASAQLQSVAFGGPPSIQTAIPVRISGQLTVQFHGDPATGCARWGVCGYGGTVTWRPPSRGVVELSRTLGRHPVTTVGFLPSIEASLVPGGVTTADVALDAAPPVPGTHCVDAAATGQVTEFPVRRGRVIVSLAGAAPALLQTRCAGPRDADVVPELPAPSLALAALRRGRTSVSLEASRALHAHGFTGSIDSTLVLRLAAPGRPSSTSTPSPSSGQGVNRVREIDVGYRATISGTVTEVVRGAGNPLMCGPLGACGTTGTITLAPSARTDHAALSAEELVARPRGRLLAAVGLAPGTAAGVTGFGLVDWLRGGSITSELTQGATRCHDAGALGAGSLLLASSQGRLRLSYSPGPFLGVLAGATRCPGPLSSQSVAAAGSVALASLRRRTVQIRLDTGFSATDAGYAIRFVPDLVVTLTRLQVRTTVVALPAGVVPAVSGQTR